ncbi:hypothetical protein BC829DRAFT_239283 [Chytridium lagenaria]|nr:hypothetical protein BC829DRAFT_239283 [Chytridium lagenaria]
MALSYPLTDLYSWHVVVLFQMGRIREAARLARDVRNKIHASGGAADPTSRDLADGLHILLCLNVGHGSHSRGLTLEVRRLAEELINRILEELTGGPRQSRHTTGGPNSKLRHANTVGHPGHPPPAASSAWKPASGNVAASSIAGSSTAWNSNGTAGVYGSTVGTPSAASLRQNNIYATNTGPPSPALASGPSRRFHQEYPKLLCHRIMAIPYRRQELCFFQFLHLLPFISQIL